MSVWVEIVWSEKLDRFSSSRSTWACELKLILSSPACFTISHAPRERVSWNYFWLGLQDTAVRSRSTWACELKYWIPNKVYLINKSRSTWACELKFWLSLYYFYGVQSRSTWACELKSRRIGIESIRIWSRSTWACELKLFSDPQGSITYRHAPRERVSWNVIVQALQKTLSVTLHVSVWVEIKWCWRRAWQNKVTLHVSVWVEIFLFNLYPDVSTSRSTWACELKCILDS